MHLEVVNADAHTEATSLPSPVQTPGQQLEILRDMPSRGGHWCPNPGGGNLPRNRDQKGRCSPNTRAQSRSQHPSESLLWQTSGVG